MALLLFLTVPRASRWRDDVNPPPGFEDALAEFDAGRIDSGVAILEELRHRWTHPLWDQRVAFLAGYWSARQLKPLAAVEQLGLIPPPEPDDDSFFPLAMHAASLRASIQLRLGRLRDAVAGTEPLLAGIPGSPAGEDILETWALAASGTGRAQEAVHRLDQEIASGDLRTPARFELLAGQMLLEEGDTSGAARRFKSVYASWPRSQYSSRALEALGTIPAPGGDWTVDDLELLQKRSETLAAGGDEAGVCETWQLATDKVPGAAADPVVRARYGIALTAEGRYRDAQPWLETRTGEPSLDAGILLARAAALLARGRRSRAESVLAPLLRPGSPAEWSARANLALGESADQSGRREEALRRYRAGLRLTDPSPENDHEAWRAGMLAFGAGRYAEALALFERLDREDTHPGYQAAGLYWRARSAERLRHPDEAVRLLRETVDEFRNDYYGIRALARLGIEPTPGPAPPRLPPPAPARFSAEAGARSDPETDPPLPDPLDYAPAARRAVAAGRELERLHLPSEAGRAYDFALAVVPSDRTLNMRLADLALAEGDRLSAVSHLLAAYPGLLSDPVTPMPARHRNALYPVEAGEEVARAAGSHSLDPFLVRGLILQESGFNPLAVSKAGALGLMQIVPSTGAELARRDGIRPFTRDTLFDPSINIRLGTAYLSDLLRRFGGHLEPALAAYNAGISRADRWWARSSKDPELFVEEIPFTETRLYIKRIYSNRRMYGLLHERDPVPERLADGREGGASHG